MSERLSGLGRGAGKVWDDDGDTYVNADWARENGQDEWGDELDAESADNDWRIKTLNEGLR